MQKFTNFYCYRGRPGVAAAEQASTIAPMTGGSAGRTIGVEDSRPCPRLALGARPAQGYPPVLLAQGCFGGAERRAILLNVGGSEP